MISFSKGKKLLANEVYPKKGKTFYCDCDYNGSSIRPKNCGLQLNKYKKRKYKLEWEHIVPAHAFGQSFEEWRNAKSICPKKKKNSSPRKCARKKNKLFREMEGNIHNLVPSVGSVNALRSNYSFTALKESEIPVCRAGFKIRNKKVSPPDERRGDIARIYMYMNDKYPGRGIISNKNKKLFMAWDKLDPVTQEECHISQLKGKLQKDENKYTINQCRKKGYLK
jgi:deoxyribonuclease-1